MTFTEKLTGDPIFEDFKDGATPTSVTLSNLANYWRVVTKIVERLPDAGFFFSSSR